LEIIMEEIGQRLVREGFRFDVFVRKHYMEGKQHLKAWKGIGLRYSPGIHSKHLDAISHSITALYKILLDDYQIVYINAIGVSLLAFVPKALGRKVIVQVHGLDFRRAKWGRIARAVLRLSCLTTVWFSDLIICVSEQDKAYFDERFGTDCVFIPNGVTAKRRIPPDLIRKNWGLDTGGYILFMGRLVKEKGCHLLLSAYLRLETDKTLVIAGDDPHNAPYCQSLKRHAGDHIHFVGYVDGLEKEELLSNAYCYVLPSTLEAMPLSVLEAMSYGRCVIASDLPELKDVLGDHGLFFETGSADGLRDAIAYALENPDLVERRGSQLKALALDRHDWDTIYKEYRTVIDRVYART
jgi:glycosyltransferase involved in cell wall biosynthesis